MSVSASIHTVRYYTQSTNLLKMSNPSERVAEDQYEEENDFSAPVSGDFADDSYTNETNANLRDQVPVQSQEQSYEDPMQPPYSNSDQQLGKAIYYPI